jgi:hypothetical protein
MTKQACVLQTRSAEGMHVSSRQRELNPRAFQSSQNGRKSAYERWPME